MDGGDESIGHKRRRPSSAIGYQGNTTSGAAASSSGTTMAYPDSTSSLGSNEASQKGKKRFVWPDDLHREFVAAIFDVGLKCASPKTILGMMKNTRDLTSEHIKSHLQKYRLHRDRAREEFVRNFGRDHDNPSKMDIDQESKGVCGDVKPVLVAAGEGPALLMAGGGERGRLGQVQQGPMTPMSIITECLQMQLGFQTMLKQALQSQQQMQAQLQAHFQAMGMSAELPLAPGASSCSRGPRSSAPFTSPSDPPTLISTSPSSSFSVPGMPPHPHHDPHHQQQPQSQFPTLHPPLSTPATQWEDSHGGGLAIGANGLSSKASSHHHHHHHHHHHGEEASSSHHNGMAMADSLRSKKTTELQMEAEMRSHMDMHRQLLIRKKDQVSQYCAGEIPNHTAPPPVPMAHTLDVDVDLSSFKWTDECLDEDLFNFLRGDDGI